MWYIHHHVLFSKRFFVLRHHKILLFSVSPSSFPIHWHSVTVCLWEFLCPGRCRWTESPVWCLCLALVQLCCGMFHYSIPTHGWLTFHHMHLSHSVWLLLIPSSAAGYQDCFHLSAFKTNTAVNISMQVFVWSCVSNSLGHIPGCGTVGSRGNSV